MSLKHFYLFLILCFAINFSLSAQKKNKEYQPLKPDTLLPITTDFVIVEDIQVMGNQKTKEHIILRELDIHQGTVLYKARLDSILLRNQNNVFNTNLFITVELWINPKSEGNPSEAVLKPMVVF